MNWLWTARLLDTIEETMMMTTRVVICVAMVISLPVQNALAASTYFRYRFKVRLSEKTPLANDPLSGLRQIPIGRRYREGCRRFGKWMLQRYISLRRVALDQLTQFVEGSCHGSFHPLQNDFLVLNVVQAEVRLRKGPRAPKGSVYYSLDNRQLT